MVGRSRPGRSRDRDANGSDEDVVEPAGMEDPFAAAMIGQPKPTENTQASTEEASVPDVPAWTPSVNQPDWGFVCQWSPVEPAPSRSRSRRRDESGGSGGDMLPNVGLVVIAIGKDRVQLAKVRGDHAVVESLASAMYM